MKPSRVTWLNLVLLSVFCFASVGRAQETVTIPKSRLEELERKAAELEKLKKELNKTRDEKAQLKKEKEQTEGEKQQLKKAKDEAEAKAAVAAAQGKVPSAYVPPPLASLPPLKEGEQVSAMDLMGHFAADPRAAVEHYGKKRIAVEGEIVEFSKPMFVRTYKIHLKTGDALKKVFCTLQPPGEYKAVYPARNGTVLVGLTSREAEVTLFKIGQSVVIEGKYAGVDDAGVHLNACGLKSVK